MYFIVIHCTKNQKQETRIFDSIEIYYTGILHNTQYIQIFLVRFNFAEGLVEKLQV